MLKKPKCYLKTITTALLFACFFAASSNSHAGNVYGKVGYGHYPIKIVVGYNGHHRDYYKPRKHYKKHYRHYQPRYYSPRGKYCRSTRKHYFYH